QQDRDIGTGDQQYHAYRAEQQVNREANIAHHLIAQPRYADGTVLVGLGILLFEPPPDGGYLSLGPSKRNSGFEAPDSKPVLRPTVFHILGAYPRRDPQIRFVRKAEARRQHTGDR